MKDQDAASIPRRSAASLLALLTILGSLACGAGAARAAGAAEPTAGPA